MNKLPSAELKKINFSFDWLNKKELLSFYYLSQNLKVFSGLQYLPSLKQVLQKV